MTQKVKRGRTKKKKTERKKDEHKEIWREDENDEKSKRQKKGK